MEEKLREENEMKKITLYLENPRIYEQLDLLIVP